jgi:quercetin dioxygenase-like cupin family protein
MPVHFGKLIISMSGGSVNKQAIFAADEAIIEDFDWGQLRWYTSGKQGNTKTTTFGQCLLRPGCENPRHLHPNCEEILHVLRGRIVHSLADETFEMGPGDTIVIPPNLVHNARNVGSEDALLTIIFSTPSRQMQRV